MNKQAFLVGLDIVQQLRRRHLLKLRDELTDSPPVKRAGQRREEVARHCQREQLRQRDGGGFEFLRPLAGLDRPSLTGGAAIGPLLGLLHGIAELLQKLDVAADVLVGHLVNHAAVTEAVLELRGRERMAGAEQDVD